MKDVYSTEIDVASFTVGKADLAIYCFPQEKGAVGAKDKKPGLPESALLMPPLAQSPL